MRLRLTNLPRVRGTFIAGLLERCPRLEVLHLENLPSCWEGQGFSSPTASRAKALRTLSILGCKVDMSAAALLAKVSELRSFTYNGPPSLMRVATTFWYVAVLPDPRHLFLRIRPPIFRTSGALHVVLQAPFCFPMCFSLPTSRLLDGQRRGLGFTQSHCICKGGPFCVWQY